VNIMINTFAVICIMYLS